MTSRAIVSVISTEESTESIYTSILCSVGSVRLRIEGSRVRNSLEALCCVLEHFILCVVLVQPRNTSKRPDMTSQLLPWT